MRHKAILSLRLPSDLLDYIERERRLASRAAGVDIKTSAMVRSIFERDMKRRRRQSCKAEKRKHQ